MKRLSLIILFAGLTICFFACNENPSTAPVFEQSEQVTTTLVKKPTSSLSCTITYNFVGHLNIFDTEGRLLAWDGEIHGDIEGTILYWMVVQVPVGPPNMPPTAPLHFFEDRFEIFVADNLVLAGESEGKTLTPKGQEEGIWRGNGFVTEASAEYEDWIGCHVADGGNVVWTDSPYTGEGKFRIN